MLVVGGLGGGITNINIMFKVSKSILCILDCVVVVVEMLGLEIMVSNS